MLMQLTGQVHAAPNDQEPAWAALRDRSADRPEKLSDVPSWVPLHKGRPVEVLADQQVRRLGSCWLLGFNGVNDSDPVRIEFWLRRQGTHGFPKFRQAFDYYAGQVMWAKPVKLGLSSGWMVYINSRDWAILTTFRLSDDGATVSLVRVEAWRSGYFWTSPNAPANTCLGLSTTEWDKCQILGTVVLLSSGPDGVHPVGGDNVANLLRSPDDYFSVPSFAAFLAQLSSRFCKSLRRHMHASVTGPNPNYTWVQVGNDAVITNEPDGPGWALAPRYE